MARKRYFRNGVWILLLCLVMLWASVATALAQAGRAEGEGPVLQLKIWTGQSKRTFVEKEKITLHVEITNVSSRDVLVGRDLWTNVSPSRVTVTVIPTDGHRMLGEAGAADGLAPNDDLTKAVLNWALLLPPGYSYGSATTLRTDLIPGTYKVRAVFTSDGTDSGSFYNPLLRHPEALERFRSESWKGDVASNELTITIVGRAGKRSAPPKQTP